MEPSMQGVGKIVIVAGIVLVLIGVALLWLPKIPYIGRLPGDIFIKRDNFTFYFPLMTSIVLSLLLTLILYLIRRFQ